MKIIVIINIGDKMMNNYVDWDELKFRDEILKLFNFMLCFSMPRIYCAACSSNSFDDLNYRMKMIRREISNSKNIQSKISLECQNQCTKRTQSDSLMMQ